MLFDPHLVPEFFMAL